MRLACVLLLASLAYAETTVEIDNAWVRVTRVKQAPHERSRFIQRNAGILVYLTDARQVLSSGDVLRSVMQKAGDVAWNEAVERVDTAASDQPVEFIVTELKPPPAGQPQPRMTLDPVKLDPQHHLVPFENDRVRVLRTLLEPHLKSPMHEHPHYVVVYLTELHTTMLLGDGKAVDNPRHPGDVAWRDFMKHETENIGDRLAVEIQIEIK
jgi:quercetin dioxygenase-like cupin family protein